MLLADDKHLVVDIGKTARLVLESLLVVLLEDCSKMYAEVGDADKNK